MFFFASREKSHSENIMFSKPLSTLLSLPMTAGEVKWKESGQLIECIFVVTGMLVQCSCTIVQNTRNKM